MTRPPSVLALDFDGVLCSSAREVLVVGVRAWAELEEADELPEPLRPLARTVPGDWDGVESSPAWSRYTDLLPLGNRAEDFGVALHALASGAAVDDQEAYDRFYATHDQGWLDAFHHEFYRQRARLRQADPATWLGLHRPFDRFLEVLRRRRGDVELAVATAKDRRSVVLLLDHFGVGDLISADAVLDKETGVDKTAHMRVLLERHDVPASRITFVDDKVNHLEKVAPVGVRPVLAAWGYNGDRERRRARELGFAVATLDTAEEVLLPA